MTATVLFYDEKWQWSPATIDLLEDKPKLEEKCFLFLQDELSFKGKADQRIGKRDQSDEHRRKVLKCFKVPDFVTNKTCAELNGYFGCKSSGKDPSHGKFKSLTTWTRILTKKIFMPGEVCRHGSAKKYEWYEMAFFTRWTSNGTNQVLCIDTPAELEERMLESLRLSGPVEFQDPFAMLRPLLDEVLKISDQYTWRMSKEIRKHETTRSKRPSFDDLNDLRRHARHLEEVQEVSVETLERLASRQEDNFKQLGLEEDYQSEAIELDGEMNLAYNVIANTDSLIMKSITLLTMIFLPATFISALFSTTFFEFHEYGWNFSTRFWIYWVVTVPLTLFVVAVWRVWIGGSARTIREKILGGSSKNKTA
ncbi:hypothetical protein CGLO_09278 [Colletotrichum gloeosporioides Cg-14]|uniref:CorA-like Mg2+ transporter n=1 Tax=Colletotrichum gloeosporioides (strain Cg-14) TaxID=1237896 RepID=T0K6V9_COLGC|nr:hypothetical protein CGLO_09278 [Colletotrichum gloeosporioides Cg-14]